MPLANPGLAPRGWMRQTVFINVVILSFFVLLFGSIYRRRPSERLRMWIAGWICAVAHFIILLYQPASAQAIRLVDIAAVSALMLCGICFVLSAKAIEAGRARRIVAAGLIVPILALAACIALEVRSLTIYLALDLLGQAAGIVFLWRYSPNRLIVAIPCTFLILACSQWSAFELFGHHGDSALAVILMELFSLFALFFAYDFRRRSAGVGTTMVGLLAWALVFPTGMLFASRWPTVAVNPEIWNIPKVMVAFGMLVVLFEDELTLAEGEREQYRSLFDGNPVPMWIFDKDSMHLLEANLAAVREYGWSREELPQLTVGDLVAETETSPVGLVELNWRLAGSAAAGPEAPQVIPGEREVRASSIRLQTQEGQEIFAEVMLQRVSFRGNEARLLMARDVTVQVRDHEQLIHLANHDPLTELPNRLLLNDRMRSAVATALRRGTKTAIICLDLDRFKHVNDTYGHAAGDSCLKEVASRLRQRLRSVDTAARTGGEEFVVILDDIGNLFDAERVANDLLFTLSAPHTFEGEKIHLTASLGIALFPDDGEDAAMLWSMADAAMYRAKQGGGNRHSFFSRS